MIWSQHWNDVIFLHYALAPSRVERLLPPGIELDTFDDQAWISLVLFRLKLRPQWLPFVPGLSSLVELNVRTYVRRRAKTGIHFLSMYADNRLAIGAARLLTPLRYRPARFTHEDHAAGWRRFTCEVVDDPGCRLAVEFRPAGPFTIARRSSLDEWLLERYRLFVGGKNGSVLAAEAEHPPWESSAALARVTECTIGNPCGLSLGLHPTAAHYSHGVAAKFGEFRQLKSSGWTVQPSRVPADEDNAHAAALSDVDNLLL